MPKKTRLHKLRNQMREKAISENSSPSAVVNNEFLSGDPLFKKDLTKSILFAVGISLFEIALYFIYYLRLFERR